MSDLQLHGQPDLAAPQDQPPLRVHLFASDASAEELRFPENSYSARNREEAALAVHSLLANTGAGARAILVETNHGNTLDPQAVTPFVPLQDPGIAALTDCLALTENNEHEGEMWMYLVPIEGNEEAVDLIERYVRQVRNEAEAADEDEYPYETRRLRVHLDTVELIANHEGYRASHSVIPKLDPTKVREQIAHLLKPETSSSEGAEVIDDPEGTDYETEDPLYKGGLLDMLPDTAPDENP